MTGKTKEEQALKENILKHHTLEGVISLISVGCKSAKSQKSWVMCFGVRIIPSDWPLHNILKKTNQATQKKNIRQKQLHGIEIRPNMFTIATTNMILRGDGKSNLMNDDFFRAVDCLV